MNQKYKLLNPGDVVIDVGCAPGKTLNHFIKF